MIVFLLSGLWHGASWNFVIWGAINGIFILVFDRFINISKLNRFVTSLFVSVMWALSLVFFRAETFGDAITMYKNLFASSTSELADYGLVASEIKFAIILLIFYIVFEVLVENRKNLYQWFVNLHYIFRWAVYLTIVVAIILFGSYGVGLNDNNFIYFQF